MATPLSSLIDRVLANFGGNAGQDLAQRQAILADFRELLLVDIPQRSTRFGRGIVTLSVGGGGAPADGAYDRPAGIRVIKHARRVSDDCPLDLHLDAQEFWNAWREPVGSAARPHAILEYGEALIFRPIPSSSAAEDIDLYGELYGQLDTYDNLTEGVELEQVELEGVLVGVATALHAARKERPEVLSLWQPIAQGRLEGIGNIGPRTGRAKHRRHARRY